METTKEETFWLIVYRFQEIAKMQSLFYLEVKKLKKIFCIMLSVLFLFNSIFPVYADDSGGIGGSFVTPTPLPGLEPGHTPADDLSRISDMLSVFWKPFTFGPSYDDAQSGGDISDDTKTYISNNISDNVILDGDYYNINANFINNVNQKVQADVHALDGYYYFESSGANTYNNINKLYKRLITSSQSKRSFFDNLTGDYYKRFCGYIDKSSVAFIAYYSGNFYYSGIEYPNTNNFALCLNPSSGRLYVFDIEKNDFD